MISLKSLTIDNKEEVDILSPIPENEEIKVKDEETKVEEEFTEEELEFIKKQDEKKKQINKLLQQKKIEDMVTVADSLWQYVREQKLDIVKDADKCDRLYEELAKDYHEFAKTLPIVLRYMVQMKEYSSRALRKYLRKTFEDMKNYTSMDDYIESQAGDYLVFLYKETHTHYSSKQISNLATNFRKQIKDENKKLKKYNDEADKKIKELDSRIELERRQKIYERLLQIKSERNSTS